MRHDTCSHAATPAARAKCRKARRDPATVQAKQDYTSYVEGRTAVETHDAALEKAIRRTAELGITIPHTEATKPEGMTDLDWHLLLRNRARYIRTPYPTREETRASLDKIWCTSCHLLHDLPACPGDVSPRREAKPEVPLHVAIGERKAQAARSAALDLPTFGNARLLAADIPEGRYAIRDANGTVKFYKLDKPEQGRWAGYVFLKAQASDNEFPVKNPASQMAVYNAILTAGVQESSALYGISLGACGVCGRTLTDADSIARGIGPHCAAKMGW